jgi:MoaA/NifB/PqqE/SkfB family radical SAM enzyme
MINPPFPQVVRIEPASACNLRCMHCPTGTLQMPRGLMSSALFDKIISELSSQAIRVFVLYHGGEPFLNKDIFRQIESLRKSHPHAFIKIVSNGMLLDDELIEKVCTSSLNQIEFSLDGLSPSESNRIRRGSDSLKTIKVVNKLLQCISEVGSSLKVAISTTQFFDAISDGKSPLDNHPSAPEWLVRSCDGVDEFKATWAMEWPRMMIDDEFSIAVFEDDEIDDVYMDNCSQLSDTITIRANGDIVPCCYDLMSDLTMGNILETPIMEIWSSHKYNLLRQSIAQKRPPKPAPIAM